MQLPSSGALTLAEIQAEFGGVDPISLSEYYRGGLYTTSNNTNVPTSGSISLSNFYGAVKEFTFTVSSNQTNANLRTLAINAGWDQSSPVVCTINGGVYISSNSTATPALTVNGSFPLGVQLTNNGLIIGMGGKGGNSGSSSGLSGGIALSASVGVSINNTGTIAGGGGGGRGGADVVVSGTDYFGFPFTDTYGGGGGGGGRSSAAANSAGGTSGGNFPGSPGGVGTVSSPGSGGAGGGNGAGNGSAGGGWGATGGGSGGSGGAAISGNSNITWVAFGTRLGAIT